MTGYTKLFGEIVNSTIWQESSDVRVVWITMLAICDQRGFVAASVPGLAKQSGVPLAQCEEALTKFKAPDPFSRTKDNEGRRIKDGDGGWYILNHAKYRAKMGEEERKAYRAEWMKEKRRAAREHGVNNVDSREQRVTPREPCERIQIQIPDTDTRYRYRYKGRYKGRYRYNSPPFCEFRACKAESRKGGRDAGDSGNGKAGGGGW